MDIQKIISLVSMNEDLPFNDARNVMDSIIRSEITPAQFGALVAFMKKKGETPEELAGMATSMRSASISVETDLPVVDTCGCGGDGMSWFNVSTASALVASAAGLYVAKHGNRAVSGNSGSADVLEALGVATNLTDIDKYKKGLQEVGLIFLLAPVFHPSMRFAATLRREIGLPTFFNILGPMTNPAGAKYQVVGASSIDLAKKIAKTMQLLGTQYTLVVHSNSGADEIDPQGTTTVYQVTPDLVKRRRCNTADFGMPEGERTDMIITDASQSANIIKRVLDGKGSKHNAPASVDRTAFIAVVINTAAALVVGGIATSFQDGAQIAADTIRSGKAKRKLQHLIEFTQDARKR